MALCTVVASREHIVHDDFAIESDDLSMVRTTSEWQSLAKGILKAELKRRDLSYADLAKKLGRIGVKEDGRNISNKISRGSFTAVFFIQCMYAIGTQTIHLEDN